MSAAAIVLDAVRTSTVSLGGRCRVVTVDGPAGSGKTTLARSVATEARRCDAAQRLGRAEVIHLDDLYDGWRGVLSVAPQVHELLCSLSEHEVATYRRYDWHQAAYAEERQLSLPDLLVVEGVGSSSGAYDDLVSLRVWVEAPRELRLDRGLARDGQEVREQWLRFEVDAEQVHARERTRARADLVVDGVSGAVSPGARARREPR